MQSNADHPSDTRTHLASKTSPRGPHFSTSCTTAAGNLEQHGILPMTNSFPSTVATSEHLSWLSADFTSRYASLQNTTVTEAAATVAAAQAPTTCSAGEGIATHFECPLVIAEDHSILLAPEFGSEVQYKKVKALKSTYLCTSSTNFCNGKKFNRKKSRSPGHTKLRDKMHHRPNCRTNLVEMLKLV